MVTIEINYNSYISFIIPICNSVVYTLFAKCFYRKTVLTHKPRYISDKSIGDCEALNTSKAGSSAIREQPIGTDAVTFLGYGSPLEEQELQSIATTVDASYSMKNGYYDALCAICTSEVNLHLANTATYQAYLNLCRLLRIHIPLPHAIEKCAVCYRSEEKCSCLRYQFNYVQHLECECRYGQYGLCVCDALPQIFCDLDEIRHYQQCLVLEVLSNFGCLQRVDEKMEHTFTEFGLLTKPARPSNYRCSQITIRLLRGFRPP